MSLGATVWLWLFAAAIIPLIIHLWSRKSGQPKMLPTFRFLPDKSISLASRIELHEKTLLFLRFLLILLLTLLLAGLFWVSDPETYRSVKIVESESSPEQSSESEDVLELQVSSEKIDRVGWLRLIEQTEYDYSPELIVVEGNFTADRFEGSVPNVRSDIEWNSTNLPEQTRLGVWSGQEDVAHGYYLERSDSDASISIESTESDEEPGALSALELTINSSTASPMKAGFRHVASLWGLNLVEAGLPENHLAAIRFGDEAFTLLDKPDRETGQMSLSPGPEFGIQLPITVSENVYNGLTQKRLNHEAKWVVIEHADSNSITLKAKPDQPYGEWFYSGIANQLLKIAVGIEKIEGPALPEEQLQFDATDQIARAGWVEKESATPFLVLLLLIVWAGERILSNRRGM